MATIGFLRFDDFLAEVTGHDEAVVRVEAGCRTRANEMVAQHQYYIECASAVAGDVVVFRFQTSQHRDYLDLSNKPKLRIMQANAETAALTVRQVLARDGFDVRPGLIAAAEESKTMGEMPEFVRMALRKEEEQDDE